MENRLADTEGYPPNDSLEAIYALNIGDFAAEHFISDDLMTRISERVAQQPEKLKRQLLELVELYSLDKTLGLLGGHAEAAGKELYNTIAETLREMVQVDACHILVKGGLYLHQDAPQQEDLKLIGSSLPAAENVHHSTQGQDVLAQAFFAPKTVELHPHDRDRLNWHPILPLQQDKVESLLATPLIEGKRRLGLILFDAYEPREFEAEFLELADAAGQVFVSASRMHLLLEETRRSLQHDNLTLNEMISLRAQMTEGIADLGISQQTFVEALANAIDARQHFTRGHSQQVAEIARTMAEQMGLNEKTVDLVYYAGLMFNLGRMDIPQEVLSRPEALSDEEREWLRNHPGVGVAFMRRIHFLSEMLPYLQSSQERWDGSGGPEGLSGRSIPLGSRILAVADAYYAMTQERPYRETPLSHAEAVAQLQQEAGSKWDPDVVATLAKMPEASFW